MRNPIKAQSDSKLNFDSELHWETEAVIASIISLKDGYFENTFMAVRYSVTSAILTILETVAMLAERVLTRCCSLRYLKRWSVYSSMNLQKVQNHWAKLELSSTESRGCNNRRTSSSFDYSRLESILGKDTQTDPPKRTEAKAIEEISSDERSLASSWAIMRRSLM